MKEVAGAILAGPRDASLMAELGLREDDFPVEEIVVWPEIMDALQLYAYMETQWRANGLGLDYNVVPLALKWSGIQTEGRQMDAIEGMRVIESEVMRRRADQMAREAQRMRYRK